MKNIGLLEKPNEKSSNGIPPKKELTILYSHIIMIVQTVA